MAALMPYVAVAQTGGYEITAHFTNDNGLPQNSINAMAQDPNGFIWMTTYGGIVRYDGQNLRVFTAANTPAMPNNSFSAMFIKNGQVEIAPSVYGGPTLSITGSNHIARTPRKDSPIFCTTGSFEFTDFGGKVPPYLLQLMPSLASEKKRKDANLEYRICAKPGVQHGYLQNEAGSIWYYNGEKGNLCSKTDIKMGDIFMLGNRLYAYSRVNGLSGWENGLPLSKPEGSLRILLDQLDADSKATLKFFYNSSHAFVKQGEKLYLLQLQHDILNAVLLSTRAPAVDLSAIIYIPAENLILAGTSVDGFYVLEPKPFTSLAYNYPQGVNSYYAKNSLYAVYAIDDTTLLTTTGLLSTHNHSNVYPLKMIDLRCFVRIKKDKLLINLQYSTFLCNDQFDNARPMSHLPRGVLKTFFSDGDTLYLALDSLLVKTLVQGDSIINMQQVRLPGHSIISLVKNDQGGIYAGTPSGLFLLKAGHQKMDSVPGMGNREIKSLFKSKHGDIWFSSDGWFRLNKKGIVRMPMDDDGHLERIHAFAEDKKGYTWISTNNGMFRFLSSDLANYDPKKGTDKLFYNYFDKSYGSVTSEYNGSCTPGMAKMNDGSFVFPSIKGLVHFYPEQIGNEESFKTMILEDVFVDTMAIRDETPVLEPGFNTLTMHVAIPYFGHRYNLQAEYKLSGGGPNWTRLPENGHIRFNRLTPGDYTLSIRNISGYGDNRIRTIDFVFTVSRYWYQRTWFWAIVAAVFGLFVLLYNRQKTKISERQKKLLEKKVLHRTQQLQQAMQELGQTVVELKTSQAKLKKTTEFREEVTSLVLHDIRSPLMFLHSITENIYASSVNAEPGSLTQKLYDLHLGVKEISAHAHQLLIWLTIQQEGFNVKKSNVSIYAMLQDICQPYLALAQQKDIRLDFTADEDLNFYTQADLLKIILRNLVDNAIKYTDEGHIHLEGRREGRDIWLVITDTGRGMEPEFVERLLSTEHSMHTGSQSGLGYRFIKDVLKKIGGKIEINSQPEAGTTITIILAGPTAV
ncbi:MAG: ATP-binding protein [Bacteroidota bacterium]